MMQMKLDIDLSAFDDILHLFEDKVEHFAKRIMDDVDLNIKESTDFKGQGRLRKEIFKQQISAGNLKVTANADYASLVENGRPGFSVKNAKVLRFVINGQVIFCKKVGPARATHFLENAVNKTESELQAIWEDTL
jgi:hypothetical protein